MRRERLELALRNIPPEKWKFFEEFASAFLVDDYPELRTTAAGVGDKGRDGETFALDETKTLFLQYSVTKDWEPKIRATISRLTETLGKPRAVVYVTNQEIGPLADDLRRSLRTEGVALDVLDKSWFLDRVNTSANREATAQNLASVFVDPLMPADRIVDRAAPALEVAEQKIALLHLALDEEDDLRAKNLTNASFESLVLSALHDTSAESPLSGETILERVGALLPSGHERQVGENVEGALRRLSKKRGPIKVDSRTRAYHLSFEEQVRLRERLGTFLVESTALEDQLEHAYFIALGLDSPGESDAVLRRELREILERILLHHAERFASALTNGEQYQTNIDDAHRIAANVRASAGPESVRASAEAVGEVLERPNAIARSHLRRLTDAYTLMAFLRETPDVQKVVKTLFSGGHVWLDASVLLPLIAEELIDDPSERHYTNIIRAARAADIQVHFTQGMLEEVESHLWRSRTYARTPRGDWNSRVPFIYTAYIVSGSSPAGFESWLENFVGSSEPLVDLATYFSEVHGLSERSLQDEVDKAPDELRAHVREIWQEAHERRRARADGDVDPGLVHRLADHDVECTVGVIQRRGLGQNSPLGYRDWYLTLDRTGVRFHQELEHRMGKGRTPFSPLMSPDFMAQYLRIGPNRNAMSRDDWEALPTISDLSRTDFRPTELIEKADAVRESLAGMDERRVARMVREQMNAFRLRRAHRSAPPPGDGAE